MNKNGVENCQLLEWDLHNVCWHVISETENHSTPSRRLIQAQSGLSASFWLPPNSFIADSQSCIVCWWEICIWFTYFFPVVLISCVSVDKEWIDTTILLDKLRSAINTNIYDFIQMNYTTTCFDHYVAIIRPLKYIKVKLPLQLQLWQTRLRSHRLLLQYACECKMLKLKNTWENVGWILRLL